MNPHELHEAAPAAQAEVLVARQHNERLAEARHTASQLNQRLGAVVSDLQGIQAEFGMDHKSIAVKLSRVDEVDGEGVDAAKPSGWLGVSIIALQEGSNEFFHAYGKKTDKMIGFKLQFTFTPDLVKGESPQGEQLVLNAGGESTIRPQTDYDRNVRGKRTTVGTPEGLSYSSTNVPKLLVYTNEFLDDNAKRVSRLEESTELIRTAMADPELNPWVEKRRAEAAALAAVDVEAARQRGAAAMAAAESGRTKDRDDAPNGRRRSLRRSQR